MTEKMRHDRIQNNDISWQRQINKVVKIVRRWRKRMEYHNDGASKNILIKTEKDSRPMGKKKYWPTAEEMDGRFRVDL